MENEDLRSMTTEAGDDNQLQDLGDIDINLQLDNSPNTLNDVFQPHQTQVQGPQHATSFPNINNQSLSQQRSSDEMTFEEFLIGLGVVRAPSQVPYPQQEAHYHSGVMPDTNNKSVSAYATGISLAPNGSTIDGMPVMVPWGVSSSETKPTTRPDASRTTNARRRCRMLRLKQQITHTLLKFLETLFNFVDFPPKSSSRSSIMAQKSTLIRFFLLLLLTLNLVFPPITASSFDHRYSVGDNVPLFANIVGPLNNPSETYQYYDLPFCRPDPVVPKKETLGEVLNGDRLTNTLYNLNFREDKVDQNLCDKKLKISELTKFRTAINVDYYFQMYYDDLPLWGFIGKMEDENWTREGSGPRYYMFKHVQFDAFYNGDQVIEIRAFSDPNHAVDITDNTEIDIKFTYSINWNSTTSEYKNRMNKYSKASLLPTQRQIHWFSFINGVAIIVLLMGLLIMLFMRHLKNDLKKYSSGDEEQDKEVGWKYVHGDVFRCPSRMALFCGILGTGTQLLTIICLLFVLSFFGVLYPYSRGIISTSLVVLFILTAPVAGYSATSFFGQFFETGWEKCVLLSGILYIGPLLITMLLLNTISMSIGATTALPFGTIVVIILAYTFIAIPMLAFGGIVGYRFRSKFQAPSATKISPREIPLLTWSRKTPGQMLISGLLTFSAIVLELHNLHATVWSYKILTLPSILFITLVLLVILTSLLSVGLTYIQLAVEDHQWWWRSIWRGGSVAIFMFAYSIYYYSRSNMSGFMQSTFFFCYNFLFCYAFFLMLATVSFCSSWLFVQHIYNAVKSE
ncbi:hypothetical protein L1987_00437 [Smallanthus sonchifolius]|uniref:Uncharacterized protein n=1 Tax=Smallanthus sonchifolius TaxID=185202 RepID=A0ACB9K297_9ASTR|nr:hypothetical protein L1987_00437 [Smallanthus sonchifolius]